MIWMLCACGFLVYAQAPQMTVKATYKSPVIGRELVVVSVPSPLGAENPLEELIGKIERGAFVEAKNLAHTAYTREYHGNSWIIGTGLNWISDRFVWTADEMGLFVADAETNTILVNNVLTAYVKSPIADQWAAIRFRPTSRAQERLDENFEDTILLLDPETMAAEAARSPDTDPLSHGKAVKASGIVLAQPEWARDGSAFAVLTWNRGTVQAVRYDANLNETSRTAVNLQVDSESALSLSLNTNLVEKAKSILSDPTVFQ